MGRPQSKDDLLAAAHEEFDRLWSAVGQVDVDDRDKAGVCETWSVKDVLAHLDEWHEMFLGWDDAGSRGEKPPMPAEGFSWSQTPALNDAIFQRHRSDGWDAVVGRLRDSHARVLKRLATYSDEELFTKKQFVWTGSTSVGSYATSATASHYSWASKLIRKAAKAFARGRG